MSEAHAPNFFHRFACLVFAFFVSLVFAFVVWAPDDAQAKSYASGPVDIKASVQENGDLAVVEQRTFTFEGAYSCVWWNLENLPDGASLEMKSVTMTTANGSLEMPEVAFDTSWRKAGGPEKLAWSFDKKKNTMYAFFEAENAEFTFTVSYVVHNAVQVYSDTAELYWQFVGSEWEVDSRDVTAEITLPVAKDEEVAVGDNVKAWGHGALTGSTSVGSDGVVSYSVSSVSAGSYAEARIAFPTSWVSGVKSGDANYHTSAHLEKIQSEEEEWANESNNFRVTQLGSLLVALLIAALAIVWAVWRFFRYGRELKPNFTDTYWRDEPLEGGHPAVVGRLIRFNDTSSQDFAATLLNLANLGAMRIEPVNSEKGILLKRMKTDYLFVPNQDFDLDQLGELDRQAYDLIFGITADSDGNVLLSGLSNRAQANAAEFQAGIERWQGQLSSEVIKAEIIEGYSESKRRANNVMAVIVVGVCTALGLYFDNIICVVPALVAAIVLVLLGRFMPRRTQLGADASARAFALKKWLKEFSTLDERPFTDIKVWGKLMVYAYVLGVADEAAKQLKNIGYAGAPDANSAVDYFDVGFWYVPMIMHASQGAPTFDFGDFANSLDASLENSLGAAQSALSEVAGGFDGDIGGGFSSGGGFGGGFSIGGGGGFGGGGGAR